MYKLKLNRNELCTLAWVGDRYESAAILYDGLQLADSDDTAYFADLQDRDTEFLWLIPEHIAWEYQEAIPADWSYPEGREEECSAIIPPCIGGLLGDKLVTLYEEMV